MTKITKWLLLGLGAAGALYLFSRTKTGQAAVQKAITKGGSIVQQLTDAGMNMIARFEGFAATRYEDPPGSGKYSIGYGHQIQPGEVFNEPISRDEAKALMAKDTAHAQQVVRNVITHALTPAQFDALTSFVYNVGENAFRTGSVPAKVNAGNFAAAAVTMKQYIHSGGKVNNALIARRDAEASAFV